MVTGDEKHLEKYDEHQVDPKWVRILLVRASQIGHQTQWAPQESLEGFKEPHYHQDQEIPHPNAVKAYLVTAMQRSSLMQLHRPSETRSSWNGKIVQSL